jgi:hypothetical protein
MLAQRAQGVLIPAEPVAITTAHVGIPSEQQAADRAPGMAGSSLEQQQQQQQQQRRAIAQPLSASDSSLQQGQPPSERPAAAQPPAAAGSSLQQGQPPSERPAAAQPPAAAGPAPPACLPMQRSRASRCHAWTTACARPASPTTATGAAPAARCRGSSCRRRTSAASTRSTGCGCEQGRGAHGTPRLWAHGVITPRAAASTLQSLHAFFMHSVSVRRRYRFWVVV